MTRFFTTIVLLLNDKKSLHIYIYLQGGDYLDLHSEFTRIMEAEIKMNPKNIRPDLLRTLYDPVYFEAAAKNILEIAKNGTVLRMGPQLGHLTNDTIAFESDGAHVNIFEELVNCVIDFALGYRSNLVEKYSRTEISKAIRIHDLLENETGDKSSNNKKVDQYKLAEEQKFFKDYLDKTILPNSASPVSYHEAERFKKHVYELLLGMHLVRPTGVKALLKVNNKAAAVLGMLSYDSMAYGTTKYCTLPHCPYMALGDPGASKLNRQQMKLCDTTYNGGYLLSEMWTIDFFHSRNFTKYDEIGYTTAVIVMTTLLIHGKWYKWREKQYIDANL